MKYKGKSSTFLSFCALSVVLGGQHRQGCASVAPTGKVDWARLSVQGTSLGDLLGGCCIAISSVGSMSKKWLQFLAPLWLLRVGCRHCSKDIEGKRESSVPSTL